MQRLIIATALAILCFPVTGQALTLKAATDIKVEGMNVDIAAQSAFKAAGTASAEVSGANTTLKGSATTVVQGGIVQIN